VTSDSDLVWLLGEFAAVMHVAIACAVTVHVLLYKRNVGAAVSWIGIAWLSPFLGALLYATMGINRVKRRAQRLRGRFQPPTVAEEKALADPADPLTPLEFAIGRLTGLPIEPGNRVEMLHSGDEAYPRMLAAIAAAEKSVGLMSYLIRAHKPGEPLHQAAVQVQRHVPGLRPELLGRVHLVGHIITAPRRCRSHASCIRIFPAHAVREPAQHRRCFGDRQAPGFTGGINIGAENIRCGQPAAHRARHAFPSLEADRRAADGRFRRRLAVHHRREIADRPLVSAAREDGTVTAASSRPVPTRTWSRSSTWRCMPSPAPSRSRGDALLPAARSADLVAGSRRVAWRQGRHRVARAFQPRLLDWARRIPLRPLIEAGCRAG
jgi:cardiolipin synthase